jgi:dihydroneopterin aldolase
MDCIHLTEIRCYGYTGYLAEEQVLGQWFEVDLTLWLDLAPAGESDDIADTLDYRKAIERVKQLIKSSKFALVEKLANAIAASILELEGVQQVRVQLSKPAAPIPDFGGKITIDIIRSRDKITGVAQSGDE